MNNKLALTTKFIQSVLDRFYDQPHAFVDTTTDAYYHNYAHIISGFAVADQFGWNLTVAQELAWLFHDSVYIPGSTTNEIMSVQRMRYAVGETWKYTKYDCFVNPSLFIDDPEKLNTILDAAEQIILDTIKHFPSTEESDRVLDMDLFGLGGNEFYTNGQQIFNEYKPMLITKFNNTRDVKSAFDNGRSAWAKKFLERTKIYRTPECEYRENVARKNLESLIIKDKNGQNS